MSALNLSVRLSSHFLTTHLLHRGADPNITDRELNTPLHYAAVGRRRASRLRIWNQLTQIGALNFKNALGITPVDIVQDNPGLNLESFAKEPWLRANFPSVANDELLASTTRHIYIIEIYKPAENRKRDWWGTIMSVHDLLYSQSYWKELLHHRRTPWLHSLTPVYTWLHVPEHNIAWIEDLCITLRLSGMWAVGKSVLSESIRARTVPSCVQKSCNGWASFIPYISYEENRTHLARAKYLRVVEHQCKIAPQQTVTPSHTETQHDKNPAKNSPHPNSSVTSTDFRGIGQGEEATHSETSTGRDICEEEKALMRAYWHDPPTLAVRRTLDQYYYHMLDTEAARDQDQVVARWAQVKGQTAHKILMVDQIWIWTNTPRRTGEDPRDVMYDSLENVNQSPEQYLLTACPFSRSPQSSSNSAGVGHLLEALSNMKNWESGTTENLEVASAISHLMTICFGVQNGFHNDNGFQFMRIFEDSIAVIVSSQINVHCCLYSHLNQG